MLFPLPLAPLSGLLVLHCASWSSYARSGQQRSGERNRWAGRQWGSAVLRAGLHWVCLGERGCGQSCGWGSIGTEDLLARYCNHLDLPPNFCGDVIRLPVAGALEPCFGCWRCHLLYMLTCNLSGWSKSAKEISQVAGVSENTIKLMYSIHSYYKRLVKKGWVACRKVNEKRVCIDDFYSSSTLSSFSLIHLSLYHCPL